MSLASSLKGAKVPGKGRSEPLWGGPEKEGITFSLLSRFLCCRERFRLLVVEGLKPTEGFNHRIEYGNMWHVCEESLAKVSPVIGAKDPLAAEKLGKYVWELPLQLYASTLCRRYPTQQEQVDHWYNVCKIQFPVYVDYWRKQKDVIDRTPLLQEQVFNVPYKLPSGRSVKLRGKWDSGDLIGKGKGAGIYLQENKTKGDIREDQMRRQLTFDLQTMMYLVALREERTSPETKWGAGVPVLGVRYNVIRRPLSGGAGTIRQHKPSKSNPQGESKQEFYSRLANDYIKAEPQTYFMRWKVEISTVDVLRFRRECLDPILETLVQWYDWVTTQTCDAQIMAHNCHWRHPYGVYNVLDEGGSSDLDEHLATGSEVGLQRCEQLFPELQG